MKEIDFQRKLAINLPPIFALISQHIRFECQFFLNPFFSHCVSLMIEQCDCYRIGGNKKHSDQ
ncbi:hypothetical protein QR98_0026440 [Sarcoptes scabiei]|uniref:Uncharacterized protein n=1 Tax=Sarcoptes scabiei TaxID=52283 RepID=A0A131ZZX5_SARSC|nr:hypothetical protein QR98_0026440 [Sarcoptes scabiei]